MKKYRTIHMKTKKAWAVIGLLLLNGAAAFAQDGNAGIKDADQKVRQYFITGTSLMYGIGGVLALIGAIKVYQKWNAGEPDTSKVAASWFGSCIFLVVVTTVIKAFFKI